MSKLGKVKTEVEHERKVSVSNPARLPNPLPAPREIVQGYWSDPSGDTSLRLIPAEQRAWWRRKEPAHGTARKKTKVEVPYDQALPHIYEAPTIAVKDRYIFNDAGREWKLEQFADGHMQAETDDDAEDLGQLPSWAGKEISGDSSAYSGSRARKMSVPEINAALKEAGGGAESPKASPSPSPVQMSGTLVLTTLDVNWKPSSWLLLQPSEPDPLGLRKWLPTPSLRSKTPLPPSRLGLSLNGESLDSEPVASLPAFETPSGNTLTIIAGSKATRPEIMPLSSSVRSSGVRRPSSSRKRYRKQTQPTSSGVLAYRRAVLAPAVKALRACIQSPSPTSTGSIPMESAVGTQLPQPRLRSVRKPALTTSQSRRSRTIAVSASTSRHLAPVNLLLEPLRLELGASSGTTEVR